MIFTYKFVENFTMKNHFSGQNMNILCKYREYQYGGIALQLYCEDEDGLLEPYCTASVCVPGALSDNEIAIKNYSENEGILDVLIENEVVNRPHRYISSDFASHIPVCTLKEHEVLP